MDEKCSVAKIWSYDKSTDALYEPSSKVQCVKVRPWKPLIQCNFDTDITKILLFEFIIKIARAGFPIVGMVHDLGQQI